MWAIAKYKPYEFHNFQQSLSEKLSNVKIFRPVYLKKGTLKTPLLGTYCFVHCDLFQDDYIIHQLKYKKGVDYFLKNYKIHQFDILAFINHLKQHQDDQGYIQSKFFYQYLVKKGTFLEGPFKSLLFNILEDNKKTMKVSIEGSNLAFIINKEMAKINFV
jgi:hypothetical protein